jgi:hypothetical protein
MMVYELPDLSGLDATKVTTLLTQLKTEIQENNPKLDLKRGVFHDTVLYYHAVLEAAIRENLDRYQTARSLRQIELDPAVADTDTVSDVLSNWGITRNDGTFSTGEVAIVVSTSTSVTVSDGSIFEANGVQFTSDDSYVSTTNAATANTANDRIMTQLSDGNYLFTIFVTAVEVGSDGQLEADMLITPNDTILNYVTSYTASNFSGGTSAETNSELVNKLQDGLSAKALSNRVNMRSMLRSLPQFVTITNQSIIGYSDTEMLRDKHSIFPLSYGGRVDWYVRGQEKLNIASLTKEATLISVNESGQGTWQFTLAKDEVPGVYEVRSILLTGDTPVSTETFSVTSDVRGLDLTDTGFVPDIKTQEEGAFSAYQTATIQFLDTVTDASSLETGDKQDYAVSATSSGHTKDLQDYIGGRDVRFFGSDVLVKAPIPCFVQVTMTINKTNADPDPDVTAIKNSIAGVVNGTGFIGRLDGSRILEVVNGYLQNNVSATDLDLLGRIFTPAYENRWIRSSDSLVVPSDVGPIASSKTVQFYVDVADISINIQSSIPTFS